MSVQAWLVGWNCMNVQTGLVECWQLWVQTIKFVEALGGKICGITSHLLTYSSLSKWLPPQDACRKLRAIIEFLLLKWESAVNSHRVFVNVYVKGALDVNTVMKWVSWVKGEIDFNDRPHSSRSVAANEDKAKQLLSLQVTKETLLWNRESFQVSHVSTYSLV